MKKIYVGNLAYTTSEQDLESQFGEFGQITHLKLIKDFATGKSKGFAFVEFETPDQAQAALAMDGQDFQGRSLKVSIAREQQGGGRRAGGGGGGRGGDSRGGRY